ncbi:MAG: SulP family inorganic anion transporter [Byssovorax sp.]
MSASPKHESALVRVFPLARTLRGYRAAAARHDLVAGLTVALFTIPQAMAYAIIAGIPPAAGIFGAAVASILGAAFGSSEFLVNGPTNALSVMLAATAALMTRSDRIVVLTLMIGAVQLVAAALRLGRFTRLVSQPVLTGFTAGAGAYIAINQLPPLLGLSKATLATSLAGWTPPHDCFFDLARTAVSLGRANPAAIGVGLATLALIRVLQKVGRRLPAPFLAIVAVTVVAHFLGLGDAARGEGKLRLLQDITPLARKLPTFAFPRFVAADFTELAAPAITIGLLGLIEAIAIGKHLAAKAGHTFDVSQQIVGEAACNLGAGLFGGFASSGSFTRSAVNYEAGAVTRLSCVFSGFIVIGVMLVAAPLANHIPLAALAGTLVHVGTKLVDVSKVKQAMATTSADRISVLATVAGVLLLEDLSHALLLGIAISIAQALGRAEGFELVSLREADDGHLVEGPLVLPIADEVIAVDLQGELFFAAADVLEQKLKAIFDGGPRFVVLRVRQAYNLDATCAQVLGSVARAARARGGALILSGVRDGMYGTLERAGIVDAIGAESVFRIAREPMRATRDALARARTLAAQKRSPEQPLSRSKSA